VSYSDQIVSVDPIIMRTVRIQKIMDNRCTTCKRRVIDFSSNKALKEYLKTGSCGKCQDEDNNICKELIN